MCVNGIRTLLKINIVRLHLVSPIAPVGYDIIPNLIKFLGDLQKYTMCHIISLQVRV